ncbi:MAG: hypothetical protein H6604_08210 [Flavobacteriales bacterium]|nr:hypothetical protein [Flavobacteriales bacterium]
MRIYLILFFVSSFVLAQKFDYSAKWKEIEKSEQNGEFKSNLPKIQEIIKQAQKEKNIKEEIRAMYYISKIKWQTESEENPTETEVFKLFQDKVTSTKGIENSLYSIILTNLYDMYFQQNRWKLREITSTEIKPNDYRTWNENQFYKEIISLYENAFNNKELLKKEKIQSWEYLMNAKDEDSMLPTLYDFLIFNYLNVVNGYSFSDEVSEKFQNDKKKYRQELINFHQNDENKTAFLYQNQLQILDENTDNTIKTKKLEQLADVYKNQEYSAEILYQAGILLNQQKNYKEAYRIANKAINSFPNSKWKVNSESLKKQIEQKSFSVTFNETSLENQNIPIKVSHKNVDKIKVKIFSVNPDIHNAKEIEVDDNILVSTKEKYVKTEVIQLKVFDDFEYHSTLVAFNPLEKGTYMLEFSDEDNSEIKFKRVIQISDYAVAKVPSKEDNRYKIYNRNTGEELKNNDFNELYRVKEVYRNNRDYDVMNLSSDLIKIDDKELEIIFLDNDRYYEYYFLKNTQTKELFRIYNPNYYKRETEEKKQTEVEVFTDRSIYRPGQTVYFKAIIYEKFKGKSTVVKNKKVTVELENVNDEDVAELELITNEFGSIFGEFILPNTGLTGEYHLNVKGDDFEENHYFSVEEYKRPKFEVEFEDLKGEFTLDNNVKVKGNAKSFAGSSISDATVKYRITRQEVFVYRYCWWIPQQSAEEISSGEVKIKNDGTFEIDFIAESSKRNEYKLKNRSYTYTIYADVTDINGETRSGETQITIGDLPKKLQLTLANSYTESDFNDFKIKSLNLNNQKTDSQGKITITKLINPADKISLPNQNLDEVEYQVYDKTTFNEKLPYYLYEKQTDKNKWKKENPIFSTEFNTEKSEEIKLNKKLEKGFYLVDAFTLYKNDTIQTQQIVEILDDKTLRSSDLIFLNLKSDKSQYKVGETATITITSNLENPYVQFYLEGNEQLLENKILKLQDGKVTEKIQITEKFLRGIFAQARIIKHNAYDSQFINVKVSAKPDDFTIETKTFRDKIEPASKQTWEFIIKGKDKDKVSTELLATMYDASLDEFKLHSYSFNPYNFWYYPSILNNNSNFRNSFNINRGSDSETITYLVNYYPKFYDLHTFGFGFNYYQRRYLKSAVAYASAPAPSGNVVEFDIVMENASPQKELKEVQIGYGSVRKKVAKRNMVRESEGEFAVDSTAAEIIDFKPEQNNKEPKVDLSKIKARTNLQETAFFYPNLKTDEEGNIKFSFTTPESLTKWKLQLLAHNQNLQIGQKTLFTQTQKELMVFPNVPRFLREGDKITISTKIDNLSDKTLNGNAQLFLFDAINNKPVDVEFTNIDAQKSFSVNQANSTEVSWEISVPKNIQAVTYRIVAKAGDFSDGEESILPILTNRKLVTETKPISIKENQEKTFVLESLKNKSNSLESFNLTLEMTTNPTWLAVMSLPYLREYPYECSEQLFSRFYGNLLSTYILNQSPKIKRVFDEWNSKELTVSRLEKNQELKNILIQETPWIREAQSETEQIKRIALFFDLNKMKNELEQAQDKLIQRQSSNGGFVWFDGGREDFYITNHIIAGFGKLNKMLGDKKSEYIKSEMESLIQKAIQFSDEEALRIYEESKKWNKKESPYLLANYFYSRSYFLDKKLPTKLQGNLKKYLDEIAKLESTSVYQKAMNALVLERYGKTEDAKRLVKSLKETSVESDEMGMYWKDNVSGWYWYQAPVETQSTAIEAFAEVTPNDINSIEEMKVWLLKNKQTNAWKTTKATTDAVYALMTFGKSYLNSEEGITIEVGNETVLPTENPTIEQASGWFKKSWKKEEITQDKAEVKIKKTSPGVAYGGLFYQYFEDLDKINVHNNQEIKFDKKLYKKEVNSEGEILKEITEKTPIKVGDKITVKLIIEVNRDMQYVHLKDMRASGFEPINVLSSYKYQNGVGYYESTKDASTNFFISRLNKGIYVFEYDVRANNKGDFSNGITELQCMYAPEMAAHSEGIRVEIN